MLGAIAGDHRDVAAAQKIYPAILVTHLNHVPGFDGFIRQNNKAAHQIGKNFLQAKTQPQSQGPAEKGEDGEIQAHIMQNQGYGGHID